MTTVSVVTPQPGAPTASNGLYLDGDHPVRVHSHYNGPYWRAECWAQIPISKRGVSCGTPATASGATTSTSADKGEPGAPCRTKVGHRKLTGTQGRGGGPVERETHGNLANTITQFRAEGA